MRQLPSFPPSNLITGSLFSKPGDFILRDIIKNSKPVLYTGPYFKIIKTGGEEYYTGLRPNEPQNKTRSKTFDTSTSPVTEIPNGGVDSNERLLTFESISSVSSTTGLRVPSNHSIVKEIKPEFYYNDVIPRFFAYNAGNRIYRETNYESYVGISTKDIKWDYINWEVKAVYGGWGINYFTPKISSSTLKQTNIIDLNQNPPYSSLYINNKLKILAIEKGYIFKTPVPPPPTPLRGISYVDGNSKNPWPGFSIWYCNNYGGSFQNSYFTLANSSGPISNDFFDISPITPPLPPSLVTGNNIVRTYYNAKNDDPSIPLSVRFYPFNNKFEPQVNIKEVNSNFKNTNNIPTDINAFLYLAAPVIKNVSPNPSGTSLGVITTYKPSTEETITYNNVLSNISEIFLNDSKYIHNPNYSLQSVKDKLVYKSTQIPYRGKFCKDFEGRYWDGLMPFSGFNTPIAGKNELIVIT
jgi:hypothetical protein